jgi:hypothetical protein
VGLRGSRSADAVDVDRRGRVTPAAWRENGPSGRDLEPRHGGPDGLHVLRCIRGRQGAVVPAAPDRWPTSGIYSSPIPPIEYPWIYHERVIRSVANSTRQDARELLRDAALVPVVSRVQEYDLEQASEALLDLKEDRVRGSAVLRVAAD